MGSPILSRILQPDRRKCLCRAVLSRRLPSECAGECAGWAALKAGFGWSAQELYEHDCYDLQVRYAVGYDRLGEGDFEIRSLYYFRERLSRYNTEKGLNLCEKAFEQSTDAQLVSLKVRTGRQRMDSPQIASNIVSASRLQLLVEGLQRVVRILSAADKTRLAETLARYLKDSAGHYTYCVKGKQALDEPLQAVGQTIHRLGQDLKTAYASEHAYRVLARLFAENFTLRLEGAHPKANAESTSGCLQAVDDLEASYRTKGTGHYKGYVANITETCDPENEIQLITKVQVAPNNLDDGQLLAEALPHLKARTDLETLVTDGGFGSEVSEAALQAQNVNLIQTALRGAQPNPNKFTLADFDIQQDEQTHPTALTCPQGQTVPVTAGRTTGWQARFAPAICAACPFQQSGHCPTPKTRPALPARLHHARYSNGQTASNPPPTRGRKPQLTLRRRSHRPLRETSLPGWQTARARKIPRHLHGYRLRRHR